MVTTLFGGALVGLAFIFVAMLRGGGSREPKPFWARSEAIESLIAVVLVSMIAIGFALVLSSVKGGWIPPALGLAVAMAGLAVAIMMATRRPAPALGPVSRVPA